MNRYKYIDVQTPHTFRKYVNNGDGSNNWLRDVISDETKKQVNEIGVNYAGDFYQSHIGGRCNCYWVNGHLGKKPYIVIAFEI